LGWEKEVAKSEENAKKLVPQRFHKWIYIFGQKISERILVKKMWYHVIELKEVFVLRKRKIYLLLRKKRGDVLLYA